MIEVYKHQNTSVVTRPVSIDVIFNTKPIPILGHIKIILYLLSPIKLGVLRSKFCSGKKQKQCCMFLTSEKCFFWSLVSKHFRLLHFLGGFEDNKQICFSVALQ